MKERFSKEEVIGCTRQILTEIAAWTDMLYGAGSAERLIGVEPGRDWERNESDVAAYVERTIAVKPRDWSIPGSAGPVIERSLLLKNIGRVVDYLNTNIWHGDPTDFWNTKIELTPFHFLLDGAWSGHGVFQKMVFSYASDGAVDERTATTVFDVLKIFFARVHFEFESKREIQNGELSLSELAIVSGLAEKTVRMAAIGQDKNPDLVTFKEGRMTFVTIEEARRWMASKKINYRPPQFTNKELLPAVDPNNIGELGTYLRTVREVSDLQTEKFVNLLGWDKAMINAYQKLEDGTIENEIAQFSTAAVIKLAKAICPSESTKLIRIIDRVIHPLLLELQIRQETTNTNIHESED